MFDPYRMELLTEKQMGAHLTLEQLNKSVLTA
jgi:hypothetical protein